MQIRHFSRFNFCRTSFFLAVSSWLYLSALLFRYLLIYTFFASLYPCRVLVLITTFFVCRFIDLHFKICQITIMLIKLQSVFFGGRQLYYKTIFDGSLKVVPFSQLRIFSHGNIIILVDFLNTLILAPMMAVRQFFL